MGYWSDKAIEEAEDRQWALGLLHEAGAIEECEYHPGTYFDGGAGVEGAYRLVSARIKAGRIAISAGKTQRDMTDLLQAVYYDNAGASGCAYCEKLVRDD